MKVTKGAATQHPLPFAFSRRDEFLATPPERRTAHLWEAYVFCEKELEGSRFSTDELQRNLRVIQRMLLKVCKQVAKKLCDDGSWRDGDDSRWPRNHRGADLDHWYDTGAYPPRFLTLPEDPVAWRQVTATDAEALFDEMIAWVETPAGKAGVGDVELQKLLADRETYLPEEKRILHAAQKSTSWQTTDSCREDSLEWLASRSADGALESWATGLELAAVQAFLGGVSSNRRPINQLLPELAKLEESGELEKLQQHLDSESPSEAAQLAILRAGLPKAV